MPRLLRPRYADVTATFALVVALGTGGAYATSLITSSQIANNAVTTSKIATNAVTTPKIAANAVTTPKIANNAVSASKLAPAIRNQLSAPWGIVPSGKSVKGQFFNTGRSGSATWVHEENVTLPDAAPVALDYSHVAFGTSVGGTTANSNCTGSYSAPTAPRGWLCVYLGFTSGLNTPALQLWSDTALRTRAFYVEFPESAINTNWNEYGTWAYTAP